MKNTKKIIMFCIVLLLLIGASISMYLVFREKPIISSEVTVLEITRTEMDNGYSSEFEVISDNWIALTDVTYYGEDVTDLIDAEEFVYFLSKTMCKRKLKSNIVYYNPDIVWDIQFVYNHKPMNIFLGSNNISDLFLDEDYYKISDPDSLEQYLENIIISTTKIK